ncbi:crossover junction endodeoxyribonuclease RuvC [Candidatus Kaiserbacteria bacterium]|nr:crossover junction endodeoxyribonuclease RuvC [Candidatus Kaiserbacteria bacterium]MCB9811521.1 crossover junction endodeoxyribonuclease RuvC [Candidatus Nomurabacteria bacterium]
MRVLGIDPGYERLGLAVVEKVDGHDTVVFSTCVQTDKELPFCDRLLAIGNELESVITTYKPECVGVETLFFNKNQKTAVAVAEARGVIEYVARRAGCVVQEFGPQEVKVAMTGYGNSDKRAVIDMVRRLVRDVPEKALDDEYDAIAVGVTCLAHQR